MSIYMERENNMDALKIQTDMLKQMYKGKVKGLYVLRDENDIYVGTNGYALYKFHKDKFFLDISKYDDIPSLKDHIDKAMKGDFATKVTKFDKPEDEKMATALEISTPGWDVYVNYDIVKPFESKKSALTFTIKDSISAVGVWENGEMVGIVMPFRYSKDGIEMRKKTERDYYE